MIQELKPNESLDLLAHQIEEHANQSEDHILEAAMLLGEARRRIETGEAGDTTWYSWAPKNIKLSKSRLRDLQRIAAANDPAKELGRQRKETQKRVKKHRGKKAAEKRGQEPERRELIAWARTAPLEQVSRLLARIPSNDNAAALAENGSGTGSKAA